MKEKSRIDFVLLLLILIAAVFVIYWVENQLYMYNNFIALHSDLAYYIYSIYVHAFYPSYVSGLQYLVFGNHISPLGVLLVPLFAIFPTPFSMIAMQDIFVALAAIMVYLCARDFANSKTLGFCLAVAFLLSPGTRGIVGFDFHMEAFIPFFVLLAFYFYMKQRTNLFLASFGCILLLLEASWPAAIALSAGLLYYELRYTKNDVAGREKRDRRIRAIYISIGLVVLFYLIYYLIANYLSAAYTSGAYLGMPPPLRDINYLGVESIQNVDIAAFLSINPIILIYLSLIGFAILFLGLGISALADPVLSAILVAPWLIETPLLRNIFFGSWNSQYFGFTLGGGAIGAILGAIILFKAKKGFFAKNREMLIPAISISTLIIALVLAAVTFGDGLQITPLVTSSINYPNYTSMSTLLQKIPPNASVMTGPDVMSHLYYILKLEEVPGFRAQIFPPGGGFEFVNLSFYWFRPDYIAIRPNSASFGMFNSTHNTLGFNFNIYQYMADNYSLVGSADGLYLYKLRNYSG